MTDINNLSEEISKMLNEYSEEVTEVTKKNVDIVAKECNEVIKKHITFKQHTGKYVKSFRVKTSYEDKFNKRKTWYVANGQHRLTHLLEHGHDLQQGGRTKAYPHIKYGEEFAKKRMEELAIKKIKEIK